MSTLPGCGRKWKPIPQTHSSFSLFMAKDIAVPPRQNANIMRPSTARPVDHPLILPIPPSRFLLIYFRTGREPMLIGSLFIIWLYKYWFDAPYMDAFVMAVLA